MMRIFKQWRAVISNREWLGMMTCLKCSQSMLILSGGRRSKSTSSKRLQIKRLRKIPLTWGRTKDLLSTLSKSNYPSNKYQRIISLKATRILHLKVNNPQIKTYPLKRRFKTITKMLMQPKIKQDWTKHKINQTIQIKKQTKMVSKNLNLNKNKNNTIKGWPKLRLNVNFYSKRKW